MKGAKTGEFASEADPAEDAKVGLVARLRRRLKRGKDTDGDAATEVADREEAPAVEDGGGRQGGQDSDVEAEEAELYARRPLVRAMDCVCVVPRTSASH